MVCVFCKVLCILSRIDMMLVACFTYQQVNKLLPPLWQAYVPPFGITATKSESTHVVIDNHIVTGQSVQSTLTAVQNLILLSNARYVTGRCLLICYLYLYELFVYIIGMPTMVLCVIIHWVYMCCENDHCAFMIRTYTHMHTHTHTHTQTHTHTHTPTHTHTHTHTLHTWSPWKKYTDTLHRYRSVAL